MPWDGDDSYRRLNVAHDDRHDADGNVTCARCANQPGDGPRWDWSRHGYMSVRQLERFWIHLRDVHRGKAQPLNGDLYQQLFDCVRRTAIFPFGKPAAYARRVIVLYHTGSFSEPLVRPRCRRFADVDYGRKRRGRRHDRIADAIQQWKSPGTADGV